MLILLQPTGGRRQISSSHCSILPPPVNLPGKNNIENTEFRPEEENYQLKQRLTMWPKDTQRPIVWIAGGRASCDDRAPLSLVTRQHEIKMFICQGANNNKQHFNEFSLKRSQFLVDPPPTKVQQWKGLSFLKCVDEVSNIACGNLNKMYVFDRTT